MWLDADFREQEILEPRILARQAPRAMRSLGRFLDIPEREDLMLVASLPPVAFTGSGDRVHWPNRAQARTGSPGNSGTLGPPVSFNGGRDVGFLTAGHVAPVQLNTTYPATVDVEDGAGSLSNAPVPVSRVPVGFGTTSGRGLGGEADAAIVVTTPAPGSSGWHAGGAGHRSKVQRHGVPVDGWVTSYLVWIGSSTGLWGDCYVVSRKNSQFSKKGDSGSAVLAGTEVIGIVVGGAPCVAGCNEYVSYVQDFDLIHRKLGCNLL